MGSGGMIVMDETTCMVDLARYFLHFTQEESCGKCVPCRVGTRQMHDTLVRITQGRGEPDDIARLEDLAGAVKTGSLCGLGQTAPNPVTSTLRYFREEYEAHIQKKQCPALVCREIVSSPCHYICPIDQEASTYIALIAQGKVQGSLRRHPPGQSAAFDLRPGLPPSRARRSAGPARRASPSRSGP